MKIKAIAAIATRAIASTVIVSIYKANKKDGKMEEMGEKMEQLLPKASSDTNKEKCSGSVVGHKLSRVWQWRFTGSRSIEIVARRECEGFGYI